MEINGNPMEIHGIRWKSIESGENQWNLVEIHGIQWKSMEIHWKSVESDGNPWKSGGSLRNPVEIHRIL